MLQPEVKALETWLEENLCLGYIEKSPSPWAVLVFFIKKKDRKLYLIQDYCPINKVTIKNPYPISLTNNLINRLSNAFWFTALDIQWGYHNIYIHKGHKERAAFSMHKGLYQPNVMLFGLMNSPTTF